jgi:hypothetical protein
VTPEKHLGQRSYDQRRYHEGAAAAMQSSRIDMLPMGFYGSPDPADCIE